MNIDQKGFATPQTKYIIFGIIVFLILGGYAYMKSPFLQRFTSNDGQYIKKLQHLPISTEPQETITLQEIKNLRTLLFEKRFERLNANLGRYQQFFEIDNRDEYKVYDAFRVYRVTHQEYEDLLNEWVDATPDTYQPYLGLAEYYHAKAWQSRGNKWASSTSDEQFEGMRHYFEKSQENLQKSLELNPRLMIAYNMLLDIAMATSSSSMENDIIKKSFEIFPDSFLIKLTASGAKEPRWGGSYGEMAKVAEAAEPYSINNPILTTLYGMIYSDKAAILQRHEKYKEAYDAYSTAMLFGDHYSFYRWRASLCHWKLNDVHKALEDINRSIELRPLIAGSHVLRSKVHYKLGNYDASVEDLRIAEIIQPDDESISIMNKWASEKLVYKGYELHRKDPTKAIDCFSSAMKYNYANHESYYWRGLTYYQTGRHEEALADFQRALNINPGHHESSEMIDRISADRS